MFDVTDRLDRLRTRSTEWLEGRRREVVADIRRLQSEELALVRVLDERGRIDASVGLDGDSARTVREKIETARALEALPAVAAAACAGRLSAEQLGAVVKLADEQTDAEWAQRAPNTPPVDLARLARTQRKPSVEEGRARYEARSLRMWWTPDEGTLQLHGKLPDVMGAKFEAMIQRLAERAKPASGQPWASFERRAADALVGMCDAVEVAERIETPAAAAKPLVVIQVPPEGPAEIAGIPLADGVVEQLRANASIEPTLIDDVGVPIVMGTRTAALSSKMVRAVLLRDGHCRCGTCEVRYGLHVHHIRPRSWGGSDDPSNLVAVCVPAGHHGMLVPHGPWALVGNPNAPDGLRVVHLDDLNAEQATQLGLPPPRAGPEAA